MLAFALCIEVLLYWVHKYLQLLYLLIVEVRRRFFGSSEEYLSLELGKDEDQGKLSGGDDT